ncbi:MAG: PAS domain S-box protein [Sulfuricurvum sp.]|nr:PAS domain S-box protein [Sulfuricurvum sp.]
METTVKNDTFILTSVINSIPDLIFYKDYLTQDGIYIGCNTAFAEFVGKPIDQIINRTDIELFGEETGALFRAKDQDILIHNTSSHYEKWITYADGRNVLLNLAKVPFHDNEGNIVGIVGIGRDITNIHQYTENIEEQKKELEDQKELYELVFKNTSSSVLIIDIEANKFIDCNESAIEILGCTSKEEVLNLSPADLSPEFQPDGRRSDEKSDEMNAIAIRNGSHIFEWKHLTKNGTEFWVEVILTPIILKHTKVLHVVWKDIADRKALEETQQSYTVELEKRVHEEVEKNRLKDQELLLQSELAQAELAKLLYSFDQNVIFSKTDLHGNITHASEAFCEISGYTYNELIGKPHNIVRHPDMEREVFKDLWESIRNGKKWQGEIKNKKKNGEYYWVLTKIEPEYNAQGEISGYAAIRQDITDQKKVEELKNTLENLNSHLEQQVHERVKEIIDLQQEIQDTQREVVFTMGAIGESRSKETGNHVRRVAEYSKLLALYCGLPQEEAEMLKQASPMHDIGKVAIPDSILNKPGRFNDEERIIMNTHTQLGYEMLKHSHRPLLKMAATVAYEHHEKWDGSGYPNGLKGEAIHIYGRITALADVFDALGSDRVYKKGWELDRILNLFKEERGKHFDPQLVDLFFDNLDEFLKIRDEFLD